MDKTIRILILDESEDDAQKIIAELRSSAVPVLTHRVASSMDLEKACNEFGPDLILSDYTLAQYDGLSAMEFVRQQYPEVPFIFVSWVIHEQSVSDALKKGATDYVFKDQLSRLPLSVQRAMREVEEHRKLRQTQRRAIEQERLTAIGQMASGIAHDFSNSLMPVLGFTEILLEQPEILKDSEKTQKFLKLIHTSAQDAMHIVGRLREFYRTADKAEVFHPLDLNQLIHETVLLTQPRWREEKLAQGIQIDVREEQGSIPQILGNESALREALTNLIFNAVDALPKGGEILIKTSGQNHQVEIAISDTGIGMSEEVARHCFEPFFTTKGRAGTGLGLAMVYGVMKRHEGVVEVKSELKKGTTFILRFPNRKIWTESETGEGKADLLSRTPKQPKLHVLVVDDEASVREVLSNYLSSEGHTCETAADGVEGFNLFKKNSFDLVVTDRAMPQLNGDQMAEKIKELSPKTPILMITGFGELMKIKGEHPKSVDKILSKPLTLTAFRQAIASFSGYTPSS